MFKTTQFKKGDTVSLKSDLTTQLTVKKVWIEEVTDGYSTWDKEMLALDNDTTVDSGKVDYYSYPIKKLAYENKELNKKIELLTKTVEDNKKEVKELNDKVFGVKNSYDTVYQYFIESMYGGSGLVEEKEETKTLEERIKELEEKLNKKINKTKKIKKTKKSKK